MTTPASDRRTLYPEIMPYRTGFLDVGGGHRVYFEESGNPLGQPAVFLHGGPGGGSSPVQRRFFDPAHYRIILFDQRGCGRSTPFGSLDHNTTWHLVGDMEALREYLGVERWLVLGGSWGSTLALSYAETHPARVSHLVLRGIFTLREWELIWFYQSGADAIFPDRFDDYLAPIPPDERHDLILAYHRRLNHPDKDIQQAAAIAWSVWEGSTLSLLPDPAREERFAEPAYAWAFARIENHYFINKGFFREDGQLILDAHRLASIPGVIVQGRYDMCTPMRTAYDLHKAWLQARFHIIDDAGHVTTEPGIVEALIRATDEFRLPG
jgi:proline iminopeptidase